MLYLLRESHGQLNKGGRAVLGEGWRLVRSKLTFTSIRSRRKKEKMGKADI